MRMKRTTILIPTYNRPAALAYVISVQQGAKKYVEDEVDQLSLWRSPKSYCPSS